MRNCAEAKSVIAEKEVPWPPDEVLGDFAESARKRRKEASKVWIDALEAEVAEVAAMPVTDANQLLNRANSPPPVLIPPHAIRLATAVRKIQSRLELLEFEWLLERFKALPPALRKRFLQVVADDGAARDNGCGRPKSESPAVSEACVKAMELYIAGQMGEGRWATICRQLLDEAATRQTRSLTFPDFVSLAAGHGHKWEDVHVVAERMCRHESHTWRRVFLAGPQDEEVPMEEIINCLRPLLAQGSDVQDWPDWAKRTRVVWRLQ